MSDESLWGDIDKIPKFETPKIILEKQAEILEEHTNGKLKGEANTYTMSNDAIGITLDLVAPLLNHYRVRLLECRHSREFYPAEIINDYNESTKKAANAEEFKTILKEELQSKGVRNIVAGLLSELSVWEKKLNIDDEVPF